MFKKYQDDLGTSFCICVKRRGGGGVGGYHGGNRGGAEIYEPVCGECRDPCALRFVPDRYPKPRNTNKDAETANYEEKASRK